MYLYILHDVYIYMYMCGTITLIYTAASGSLKRVHLCGSHARERYIFSMAPAFPFMMRNSGLNVNNNIYELMRTQSIDVITAFFFDVNARVDVQCIYSF